MRLKRIAVLILVLSMIFFNVSAETEKRENSFRYQNGKRVNDEYRIDNAILFSDDNGLKGIDVSTFQGNIDWEKVKNSGIDFAIIRCGYGDDLEKYDDNCWERNADECTRIGMPFGAYLYSYAASVEEAQSEAAHAIRLLKGYKLSYPIYLDLEDNVVGACSNEMIGQIADIFCTALQNEGYEVGIYANLNWWNTRLTSSVFDNSSWHKWVAQWSSQCTYGGVYTMWQYTSGGTVDGISSNVDMNIWYGGINDSDESIKGDINGDKRADSADAGLILRYDAGLIELNENQLLNADMNGDGKINSADAGLILRKDAGL